MTRRGLGTAVMLWVGLVLGCGESGGGDDEVFMDPNPGLPPASDDPHAWGEANAGLPMPFEGAHLTALGGDAYLYVKALTEKVEGEEQTEIGSLSGVYRMDGDTLEWERVAGKPIRYGIAGLVAGPDEALYAHREDALWRLEGGEWVRLADAPGAFDALAVQPAFDEGALFAFFDEGRGLYRYDLAADEWAVFMDGGAKAEGFGLPGRHPHDSEAFSSDGILYVSRKWAIRDTEGETGCVFAFDGESWRDVTRNLRDTTDEGLPIHLLDATGSGWGPFGTIRLAPDGVDLIGTTEQGAFRYSAGDDRWEPVAAIWYGARVFVAGPYLVVGKDRLEVHLNELERLRVGSYDRISGRELREVVSPRENLLVSRFRRRTEYRGERYEYQTIVVTRLDPDGLVLSRNLDLDHASYEGTDDHDEVAELAWDTSGDRLYATWNEHAGRDDARGVLSVRAPDGAEQLRVELASPIGDAVAAPDGGVWVVTRDAALRFDGASSEPVAELPLGDREGGTRRIDVGADGTLAVLAHHTILLADDAGHPRGELSLRRSYVEDVAVSTAAGLVYAVGFDNQHNGAPVQVPYLVAHGLDDLEQRWKVWGHDPSTLDDDMADSRLYRVVVGGNGDLYVAGEVAGGNTVFRWNGRDLETPTLVTYDPYNHATNTGSEHKGYVARLDAATGEVQRGLMIIARRSDGRGNTFRPRGLAVDEDGVTYVTGRSAARFAGRDLNHVDGEPVGEYAGGDPSLLVLAPDFGDRLRWTTFVRDGAAGSLRSVALSSARVALGVTADKGQLFLTEGGRPAMNPAADDDRSDVWLAIYTR
jgi:hypothetical protein